VPCGVVSTPRLAAPQVWVTEKENDMSDYRLPATGYY
jgi:hypothetical protein